MRSIYLMLFILIVSSCNQTQNNTLKKILNEDQLPSQSFNVNINSDTTLITQGGCIIKIPKGSLESDSSSIKLDIKEALTPTEILLAGMTTQSGKQALSSGGMIYFNAASGYKISIKKAIEILVPTNNYNRDMKVYKGKKDQNDKINWEDPAPLPKDSTTRKIDEGETLFKSNCTSCHKIYEEFVGPGLYRVTDHRPKKWLYDYTRHATEMSGAASINTDSAYYYHNDPYAICLKNKYGNVVMTSFSELSDDDLDKLYGYIKSESDKRPVANYPLAQTCCDSCEAYKRISSLDKEKKNLINENGDFFSLERTIPLPQINIPVTIAPYSEVTPIYAKAVYYTINISAVGWYNIDILMKEYSACQESELFVRIQGNYKIDLNVVLVIPSVKAFVEGGKLKDSEQYGFDENNGKIPLPQDAQSYILAFGEYENKIIFGKTIFNAQLKQTIDIAVAETTKKSMIAEIKALNLDGVGTIIEKSRNAGNAGKIIETNKNINEAEKLKPKNCNCDLEPNTVPKK